MQLPDEVSANLTDLLERLLAGDAICVHRYPQLHRALHNPEIADRQVLDQILTLLARRLEVTNDVFYAVYVDVNDEVIERAEQVFRRYLKEVNRNVELFDIVRTALGGEALEVGDRFSFSELLHNIMQDRQLVDRLIRLTAEETQMKDPPPDQALRRLLEDMSRYVYLVNADELEYVVTGEYQLFNQWLDFVADKEGVDLEALEGEEPDDGVAAQRPLL